MQFKLIIFTTLLASAALLAGCGGSTDTTNSSNSSKASNANVLPINSNGGLETTKKPEAATTNYAPTLKPVVVAYYDALKKKDDAALKKVLSNEFVKSLEADMKAEKKTSLAAYVAETDRVPEGGIEVRNEKIDGDTGVAEVKGGSYINWTPLGFVREGGVWKLTNESPDINAVTKGTK
jgi:hypothetical protein